VTGAIRTDFDGDGFNDLAIGVRFEDVGNTSDAGAVTVVHGSAMGLGGQLTTWHQNSSGILGTAATRDFFSNALATGDFDGDGFADLAVGAQLDDPGGVEDTGAVNLLYGSAQGVTATGNQLWHQDSPAVPEVADPGDQFGAALAAGDFNRDGFDDLAVGAPKEDVGTVADAGAVVVLPGSVDGLTGTGSRLIHQDRPGVDGQADALDQFGSALAAGNMGRGGFADLAIGVSFDDVGAALGAGLVTVLYGSTGGVALTGGQTWHQDVAGIADEPENPDRFGRSLAIGNVGGTGQGDLVVGVPFEALGDLSGAGAVQVIYGSTTGLTAAGSQFWHQDSTGVIGIAELNDRFGLSVAVGNLGRGQPADLVVGVPLEDAGGEDAGVVNVLYGTPSGLSAEGTQLWYQDTPGVAGGAEDGDGFGSSLAIGQFGMGTAGDLAVGVPVEKLGTIVGAGVVNVIYGSASGLTAEGSQLWSQDSDGSDDAAESTDIFAGSLAST
jgi:disulfide bond formation protein DsbB